MAGCSAGVNNTSTPVEVDADNRDIEERQVTLTDGRMVICLEFGEESISCDWANATVATDFH